MLHKTEEGLLWCQVNNCFSQAIYKLCAAQKADWKALPPVQGSVYADIAILHLQCQLRGKGVCRFA